MKKTASEIKEYKDAYAADLQAAIERQVKRDAKATHKLMSNIKAVEFKQAYK